MFINSGLDNTANVNRIVQKVNNRINILDKVIKYTGIKTRKILYDSLILSVFNYCIEVNMSNNYYQNNKLYVLLNKCIHSVLGFQSYKMNTVTILNKLNWLSFQQMVISGSLKTIYKMIFAKEPRALT